MAKQQERKPTIETQEKLTAELIPPEGHNNVGYKIFQVLEEILKFKSDLGLPAKWARNYELGRNKHWKKETKKASLVTANLLFTHRARVVNMLTDNNPTFNVRQVGETDPEKEEVFETLLHTAEYWWTEQEQQAVLESSILNGETYGCTIEKVVFDSDLEGGFGEVATELVDPFHFGWYPCKIMDIQKAEAILHFWPMSCREARRKWTDCAEIIKSDKEYLKELGDERIGVQAGKSGRTSEGYFSTVSGIIKNMFNTAEETKGISDEVLIVECWVKDYTRIPVSGKENTFQDKYPGNIRCIQVCNGGKVVLSDRHNPSINPDLEPIQASKTYLFNRFPFNVTQSLPDTTNPWGMSDYEQLESLNMEVDKTISQMTLMKDQVSRLKIINPKDSGISNKEFTNAPGILNPASGLVAQGIRYLDLPQIPYADIANALNIYKDFFFLVAGSFELESAQTPGREVIAYKAIAALLERAAIMLRGKIRGYSKMIRERGRMYLSHVMNWYTEERWISYEENGEEMTAAIHGRDMLIPAKLGVVSGSTMPVSRIQEREEAIELFKLGAVDAEALLEKIDWPDKKQIVARMRLGPIGEFLERLGMMGAPPVMLEGFADIGEMDSKEFERELEKGAIPMFTDLLVPMEQQNQPTPQENAELMKADAEIRKADAEIRLIEEKINTEKVNQSVSIAGVEFDREKLAIERAKVVNEIKVSENEKKKEAKELSAGTTTPKKKQKVQGPHREQGLKSNNKKKGPQK